MQPRKKVLFTSHVANFSKFNRPFMRWFSEQGYDVHYASTGEEIVLDCDKHFNIPFERSPFKLNNLRAIFRLKKIIDSEQYDIIHTHTPMGSVVTRLAALSSRKNHKTRVIYTAHGFHFFKGAPLLNWLIYYPIERFMARHTDTLITINHEDYNRAKRSFKTDVVYISGVGVNPTHFRQGMTMDEKQKLRESLGIRNDDFVMIYPAELSKRKRQIWLINSLVTIIKSDSMYHLLLPGKDSMNGKCQRLVKVLGLDNNIHFLGYRNDIPKLMMISDLAVSSSSQEGLPVNILEAMAIGLPVVATNCRGNSDLIQQGKNGFVVGINDAEALTAIITQLRNDEVSRNRMSMANRDIIENYILEKIIADMAEIYIVTEPIVHIDRRVIATGNIYG
ncbi:MAG: hypothetical protein JWN75_479 [Candidatus Saccharibacteria bacterium]|nr:hypothetical protein [Candidatus Saccharibacteria bacterium]